MRTAISRLCAIKHYILFAAISLACFLAGQYMYAMDDVWAWSYGELISQGILPYAGYNTIVGPIGIAISAVPTLISGHLYMMPIAAAFLWIASVILSVKACAIVRPRSWTKPVLFAALMLAGAQMRLEYNSLSYLMGLGLICAIHAAGSNIRARHAIGMAALATMTIGIKASYGIMIAGGAAAAIMWGHAPRADRPRRTIGLLAAYAGTMLSLLSVTAAVMHRLGILGGYIDQCISGALGHAGNDGDMTPLRAAFYVIALSFSMPAIACTVHRAQGKGRVPPAAMAAAMFCLATAVNMAPTFNPYHAILLAGAYAMAVAAYHDAAGPIGRKMAVICCILAGGLAALIYDGSSGIGQDGRHAGMVTAMDGHQYLVHDGTAINAVSRHIDGNREHRYMFISGYSMGTGLLRDGTYAKYLSFPLAGNLGSADPIAELERSGCDRFILPSMPYRSYDRLVDRRILEYFNAQEPIGRISADGGGDYLIYAGPAHKGEKER